MTKILYRTLQTGANINKKEEGKGKPSPILKMRKEQEQKKNAIQTIEDKTEENIVQPVNYRQQAIEDQERLWAREDKIREHIESREDSAWQRAVEDMKKSGVNPNLVDAGPAQSGGGISSASGIDYTMQQEEYDRETQKIIQAIANEFQMNENQKDRLADLVGRLLGASGTIAGAQILKK